MHAAALAPTRLDLPRAFFVEHRQLSHHQNRLPVCGLHECSWCCNWHGWAGVWCMRRRQKTHAALQALKTIGTGGRQWRTAQDGQISSQ